MLKRAYILSFILTSILYYHFKIKKKVKVNKIAVVLGTGGHCRVILSILFSQEEYSDIRVVELNKLRPGEVIMGIKVEAMPSLDHLREVKDLSFFLGIGCNKMRKYYWELFSEEGFNSPNLISSNALIDPTVKLGQANVICPNAFIGPCAQLGDNNLINTASILEHETIIGSHSHIAPKSVLAGRSIIHDSCFIGTGASIIDGVEVASHTTIGAGATLIKSTTKSHQTLVGIPARPIKK